MNIVLDLDGFQQVIAVSKAQYTSGRLGYAVQIPEHYAPSNLPTSGMSCFTLEFEATGQRDYLNRPVFKCITSLYNLIGG